MEYSRAIAAHCPGFLIQFVIYSIKRYTFAMGGSISMLMKLMTGAALAAAVLAGATPAEAQSFQSVVEAFYNDEFRAHPIAATDIGVHDYDAEVDDLSQDGQASNAARLHKVLDALTAIDPANLSAGDRDDREMHSSFWTSRRSVISRVTAVFRSRPSRVCVARRSLAIGHRSREADPNAACDRQG